MADPCFEIAEDPNNAYKYTAKGNLVAVISNGTAVLGLGDIGALASKPVMEGKGVLFKIFADIDVFDIELDTTDPDKFVETVKLNLVDPKNFKTYDELKAKLNQVLSGGAKVTTAETISAQTGTDDIEDLVAVTAATSDTVTVSSSVDSDDDEDTLSYFAKLAEED